MWINTRLSLAVLALLGSAAWAHDPNPNVTWAVEVSRIVYKHCVSCHRQGGQAFSLLDYRDAQPRASAILRDVLTRRMPPWGAVAGVGDFQNDPSLSQLERDTIVGWVEAGAPEGNAAYLPEIPSFDYVADAPPAHIVRSVTVAAGIPNVLPEDSSVFAIVPVRAGEMELTAYEPDGQVMHLIWLREYRPESHRTFVCRTPVQLPKGTQVMLYGPAGAAVQLQLLRRPTRETGLQPQLVRARHSTATVLPALEVQAGRSVRAGIPAFVCPMHPEVRSADAGKCPRCGMKLVPTIPDAAEYPIEFRAAPPHIPAEAEITLEIHIVDPKTRQTVKSFEVVHEKLLHLFLVSQDLEYFAHLHPEIQPDGWFRLRTTLPKAGSYRFLADFNPAGGTPQLVVKTFSTAGYRQPLGGSIPDLQADLGTKHATNMNVELTTFPLIPVAGSKTFLYFRITPAEGLEPYLGVWGHLLAVSNDSIDMLHTHPSITGSGPPSPIPWASWTVPFKLFFPRGGMYKIWAQFQRKGVVNTVSFTLRVRPEAR